MPLIELQELPVHLKPQEDLDRIRAAMSDLRTHADSITNRVSALWNEIVLQNQDHVEMGDTLIQNVPGISNTVQMAMAAVEDLESSIEDQIHAISPPQTLATTNSAGVRSDARHEDASNSSEGDTDDSHQP
jgi:hypothetical protein